MLYFLFFSLELVQKTSKDDSRDFLFYLAVANYRLKVSAVSKMTPMFSCCWQASC